MKVYIFENAPDLKREMSRAARQSTGHIVDFDLDKYLPLLDDPALSDDQKRRVIEAMCAIMITFVELGFGTHPAVQACGQVDLRLDLKGDTDSNISEGQAGPLSEDFNHDPDT